MEAILKKCIKLATDSRRFFEGHANSRFEFVNNCRDRLARTCFGLLSLYLRSLSQKKLENIILNTCSMSPILATTAHWADWALHRQGFNGKLEKQPHTVFVKSGFNYIEEFIKSYLPKISQRTRFILISGDSDETIPFQTDQRFAAYSNEQVELLRRLHDDPRLISWFSQNIDFRWRKMHAIPLGYWEHGGSKLLRNQKNQRIQPIQNKPLKIFCAHRIRPGSQWEKRKRVTSLALNEWKQWVDYYEHIPARDFFSTISRYPFVMCVGGGGLDPSPKAWTALMAGAIPIIERNPTTEAYSDLPVVYIDSWESLVLDQDTLRRWLDTFQPSFNDPVLRQEILRRLSMGYWLAKIKAQAAIDAKAAG